MSATFLRKVLAVDAAASAAAGLLMAAGAPLLAPALGLNPGIMVIAGLALAPFVVFVTWLALQAQPNRAAVQALIVVNLAWIAASILVLAIEQPNALGYAFVLGQAGFVALMAELQYVGLKRMRAAA